jgi:DNA-directed RNA polymerase specialized sigma24 family protein
MISSNTLECKMNNEDLYNEVHKTAFITSQNICKNYHDAEDIAQDVCLKYLLKKDDAKKPIDDPVNWSKTVAKNEALKRLGKRKQVSQSAEMESISDPKTTEDNSISPVAEEYDFPDLPDMDKNEAKELLNKEDYTTYKSFIKHNCKTGDYAKANKLTANAASSRVYRMKRNLKSAYLLKMGYLGGKDILDYQTNKNIVKFVKVFAKKMQENDLKSLKKYFQKMDVADIPELDIAEFAVFDIGRNLDDEYHMLYGYVDSEGEVKFVNMGFVLDKKKHIRITKVKFPSAVYKVDITMKEAKKLMPKPIKGVSPISCEAAYERAVKYLKNKEEDEGKD